MASLFQGFDWVKKRGAPGHQLEFDSISESFESNALQQEGTCTLILGISTSISQAEKLYKTIFEKRDLLFFQPVRLEHWCDQGADKKGQRGRGEGTVIHQKGQPRSRQEQGRWLQTKSTASWPGKAGDLKQGSRSKPDQNSAAQTRQL